MALKEGIDLALDRVLTKPTAEQMAVAESPEQLAVRETPLTKVRIPPQLLAGITPLQPPTQPKVRIPP